MQWSDAIQAHLDAIQPITVTPELLHKVLSLVDLTRLNSGDTESDIAMFSEQAITPYGNVAAVCVYPEFVRMLAAQFAKTSVKVATVVNFPHGNDSLEFVLSEIGRALQDGANEIDVVFPYERYLAGERQYAHSFISTCKAACGNDVALKVILETGALVDLALIADVSLDAITAGADFIKTSTGKISEGATLEAAAAMLLVIKHAQPKLGRHVGIKLSGGIRENQQAVQYIALAEEIMGQGWVSPDTFRIGASQLVNELFKELNK